MYICIYVYMYICTYVYTYIGVYLYTYIRISYIRIYIYIYIYMYVYAHVYIHITIHIYIYVYIYIYTNIYIYILDLSCRYPATARETCTRWHLHNTSLHIVCLDFKFSPTFGHASALSQAVCPGVMPLVNFAQC